MVEGGRGPFDGANKKAPFASEEGFVSVADDQFFFSSSAASSAPSRASSTASSTLFDVDSSPPFLMVSMASSTSSPACSTGPFLSHAAMPRLSVAASIDDQSTLVLTFICVLRGEYRPFIDP